MNIQAIAGKINSVGARLYLVGGAVRDYLLGVEPYDFDYVVVGMEKSTFEELFPEAVSRGKSFPVYDIQGKEFALARKERKTGSGHKEFEMITGKDISLEDDLKRRDITINSMALDVLTNEIIDPYGGREDIKNKKIRATSEAFLEDPLRVYRVARFAAKLGFEVDEKTLELMNMAKSELDTLSSERIVSELIKVLSYDKPSIFFKTLRKSNTLDVHFIEIYNMIDVPQPELYHPEGDVFNHTMIVVDKVAKMTKEPHIVFAGLVHDFGKTTTPKDILPRHIGHEARGEDLVRDFCNRLKLPTIYKKSGVTACLEHMRAGIYSKMRTATKVDFLVRLNKSVLGLKGIEIIANADRSRIEEQSINENKIEFAELGERMIQEVDAKKYPKDMDFTILKEKVREERIKWLEEKENV